MDKFLCSRILVGAAAVLAAAAVWGETPETLGFWTFEGTSGQLISETRETVTFPNRVSGSDATLQVTFRDCNTSVKGSDAPIPLYTNEVQYAYLFSDPACTGSYVTCTSSLFSKARPGGSSGTYGRARSTLCVTNIGAALGTSSFALEFVYKTKSMTGWMRFLQFLSPGRASAPFTLFSNGATSGIGYFSLTASSGSSQSYPNMASGNTTAISALDGGWHHFAIKWSASTRKWSLIVDYHTSQEYQVTDETLGLTEKAYFEIFAINDSFNADDTFVQAVRLTRGDLPTSRMLRVSKFTTPPETVGRYRFDGTIGSTFAYCTNSVMDRADLRLYLANPASRAIVNSPYSEPPKKYLRDGKSIAKNPSSSSTADGQWMCFRGDAGGSYRALTQSFTHEFFFKTRVMTSPYGNMLFMGEGGGSYANTANGAVWYLGLASSSSVQGRARLQFHYRDVTGGVATVRKADDVYVPTNEWHHVAVTYDQSARKVALYLDGKSKFSRTFADGVEFARGTAFYMPVGDTRFDWNGHFNGAWDEYRITRRALEPGEFLKSSNGTGLAVRLY